MSDVSSLWKGNRAYWLCQGAGWSAFFCLRTAAAFAVAEPAWPPLLLQASAALIGFSVTHVLRARIHAACWNRLSWRRLVPRILVAVALCSFAWTALLWPVSEWALGAPSEEIGTVQVFLLLSLNQALFLCVWLGLYFGYQAFQKSQRDSMERLRLERAVSEAELKALKSQVNPHFLFNSLNSVRALIDEDPARAREAVTQLAHLLRAALQAGSRETVPLRQELQTAENYLALEKLRHEDRLAFAFDIDPAALAVELPPMLLQTLVENAVKYGVGGNPGGTRISVGARLESGELDLRVENTGRLAGAPRENSTGLGLQNARERLNLLFGRGARLDLAETGAGTVAAVVRVPLRAVRGARSPAQIPSQ